MRRTARITAATITVFVIAALTHAALAQNMFGAGAAASMPPEAAGGLIGWILRQQAIYYREFTGMIRAAKGTGGIAYGLLGLSFTYGVFHAAGPGHGKAVISSYLFATGESWRRGVGLSFASALMQSLVAVAIVGVFALALGSTAKVMGSAARNIEIASYLLVIAVGLRLAGVKGRGFLAGWRALGTSANSHAAHHADHNGHAQHDHGHDHHHDRGHSHHHDYGAAHSHDGDCAHCGHSHGPAPQDLAGPGGWRRGLSAVFAAGLRPCSGAIIVLVFSLTQGLFWTGVASTFAMGAGTAITVAALASLAVGARSVAARLAFGGRTGFGLVALRGVELCAAVMIALVGLLLLTGYLASERMFLS